MSTDMKVALVIIAGVALEFFLLLGILASKQPKPDLVQEALTTALYAANHRPQSESAIYYALTGDTPTHQCWRLP